MSILTVDVAEAKRQAAEAIAHFEFIVDHTSYTGNPPDWRDLGSIKDMLDELPGSEFRDSCAWSVSYYILEKLRVYVGGRWKIEKAKTSRRRNQPYIYGYGNLDYEHAYRSYFDISSNTDLKYARAHIETAEKCYQKFLKFKAVVLPYLTELDSKEHLISLGKENDLIPQWSSSNLVKNEIKRLGLMAKLCGKNVT